jgi:hypothetical protein
MNNVTEAPDNPALEGARPTSVIWSRRRVFWLCFALTAVLYANPDYWSWPERRDPANWDYFSQVIARGGTPFKDVVNIKTPASAYIGAAAILVGKPVGLRDIYAIRTTYKLLAALSVALTFMVASRFSDSFRHGILAAIILAGIQAFAILNISGVQPKTPMILFGLATLLAIMKDRPFTAGVFGMLSALSWQPGLLFVGVAGLGFSRYFTNWRDLKVARLLAGAALPLAVFLVYLVAAGALRDFFLWCFHYPFTIYGPRDQTTAQAFFDRLDLLLDENFARDRAYFKLALGGLVFAVATEAWHAFKHGGKSLLQRAPWHQVIIAAIVYFVFCRIDMQGEQDLIPLLPFVAILAAGLIIYLLDAVTSLLARRESASRRGWTGKLSFAVVCAVLLGIGLSGLLSIRTPSIRLNDQMTDAVQVVSQLEPGDKMFVHGRTEMLVLSGFQNSSKYTNLDHGKDNYLDQVEPGGFAGWFDRLRTDAPKIVAISRTQNLDRKEDFLEWLSSDYEERTSGVFTYYVRKDH